MPGHQGYPFNLIHTIFPTWYCSSIFFIIYNLYYYFFLLLLYDKYNKLNKCSSLVYIKYIKRKKNFIKLWNSS